MLIEFWKVTKVMNISLVAEPGQLPRLKIMNRASYVESNTKKWDDEATRYMIYALMPCVAGYFVYSLLYERHKNWCIAGLTCHCLHLVYKSRMDVCNSPEGFYILASCSN
jgi:hypothetical protein